MSILYLLVPVALLLGAAFLAAFLTQVARGQYDDLKTPAHRILLDDERPETAKERARTSR